MVGAAERRQRIVDERDAIRPVGCGRRQERLKQLLDLGRCGGADDEHETRAPILIGPARKSRGRMQKMLNAVDHQRGIRLYPALR